RRSEVKRQQRLAGARCTEKNAQTLQARVVRDKCLSNRAAYRDCKGGTTSRRERVRNCARSTAGANQPQTEQTQYSQQPTPRAFDNDLKRRLSCAAHGARTYTGGFRWV